jgi:hypothetical protein
MNDFNIKKEPNEVKFEEKDNKEDISQNFKVNDPNSIAYVKYGRRTLEKGTQAYYEMRERNNKAIHKHRQKKRDEMKMKITTTPPPPIICENNKNISSSSNLDTSSIYIKKETTNDKIQSLVIKRRNSSVDETESNDENIQFMKHEYPKLKLYFEKNHFLDNVVKIKIRELFQSLEYKLSNVY